MINAKYQLGDLALVQIDCLPPSVQRGNSAPQLVLAKNVNGSAYTLTCVSLKSTNKELPTLHSVGLANYVAISTSAVLEYDGHIPLQVDPGIYRIKRESEYNYKDHGHDVAENAVLVGKALGFDAAHLRELEFASIMHDIGLSGFEESLFASKWFDDDDWAMVKEHPARGARIVENLMGRLPYATDRAKEYVLHHHAHFDGSGYPDGLAGVNIPIGSRIILIADAFHAMTNWRPFREPLPEHVALDRLFADAGYCYDPKLLAVFASVLDEKAIASLAS